MSIVEIGIFLTKYITVPIVLIVVGFFLGMAYEKNAQEKREARAEVNLRYSGRAFNDSELKEMAERLQQLQQKAGRQR